MKTTQKHFEFFKKECEKWIDRFELHNWSVHYSQCRLDDYARTRSDLQGMVATIALTDDWDDEIRPLSEGELAKSAKHEVIHLLLAKLDILANARFATEHELNQVEHEIVCKLEHIIK